MKIYSKRAFDVAQHMARNAVKGGYAQGYDYDWDCAMIMLKTAYGFSKLEHSASFYEDKDED